MLLRNRAVLGAKIRRQFPIGPYIADFCGPEQMLVIEVDGQTHEGRGEDDALREAFISRQGYRVIRFTNADVLTNSTGVLEIVVRLLNPTPHPNPLPKGERGFAPAPQTRQSI